MTVQTCQQTVTMTEMMVQLLYSLWNHQALSSKNPHITASI
jgi:hypothetical protein